MTARCAIEPVAVYPLAHKRTARDRYDDLQSTLVEDIPAARESRQLSDSIAPLRLRLVELSGNATLTVIARMLHEITQRHNASPPQVHVIRRRANVSYVGHHQRR